MLATYYIIAATWKNQFIQTFASVFQKSYWDEGFEVNSEEQGRIIKENLCLIVVSDRCTSITISAAEHKKSHENMNTHRTRTMLHMS